VDLALKEIRFTDSSQGKLRWELFAESGAYDKPADTSFLDKVRFIVHDAHPFGPLTVIARRGEYPHVTRDVRLSGGVTAEGEKGFSFATETVSYSAGRRQFTAPDRVRLTDGALSVEGVGMDLSVARQEARIHSQVVATIDPGKRK
jgi:LPS export ABC transporter protein LptC